MGLDQYLEAEWFNFRSSGVEVGIDTHGFPVKRVFIEVGYWRKANAIHRWFVENVQNGIDDCGKYIVSRRDLEDLLEVCKEVLDSEVLKDPFTAEALLPTQEGFFFGSTEYDEYYIETLEDTVDIINKCLSLPKRWSFRYYSSW